MVLQKSKNVCKDLVNIIYYIDFETRPLYIAVHTTPRAITSRLYCRGLKHNIKNTNGDFFVVHHTKHIIGFSCDFRGQVFRTTL